MKRRIWIKYAVFFLSAALIMGAPMAALCDDGRDMRLDTGDDKPIPDGPGVTRAITAFDAIHDQAEPDTVLAGIYGYLRDDGVFLMQDIAASSYVEKNLDHPVGTLLYALSTMHCMTVSLAQGGMGLGTMWGEEKAREMLAQAGFGEVQTKKLLHDFQNNFYVIRK